MGAGGVVKLETSTNNEAICQKAPANQKLIQAQLKSPVIFEVMMVLESAFRAHRWRFACLEKVIDILFRAVVSN